MKKRFQKLTANVIVFLLTAALLPVWPAAVFLAEEMPEKMEVSVKREAVREVTAQEEQEPFRKTKAGEEGKPVLEDGTGEKKESDEPVRGESEEKEPSHGEAENIEVSDAVEFSQVLCQQEDTGLSGKKFASKCLIVGEDTDVEVLEVQPDMVVEGYERLMILFFDTEENTKKAYAQLVENDVAVEPDVEFFACRQPDVQSAGESPKEMAQERIIRAETGTETVVAVLDTGYDAASCGEQRLTGGVSFTGGGDFADENGHGTSVSNIILEHTGDYVKVMPVKVAGASGSTTSLRLYMGIKYAIENHADIINISMSAYKSMHSGILEDAIREAYAAGIPVIVSAGNSGDQTKNYSPANVREAITVSAVNKDKSRDICSNYGEEVDYCAYGRVQVHGAGNETVTLSGTSAAASMVSAAAALIKSQNFGMVPKELTGRMDEMAEDLGDEGKDIYFGRGLLTPGGHPEGGEDGGIREEDTQNKELPELFTCDWKSLPDEALNELISSVDDISKKRFLDRMPEEDKKELLSRKDILYHHRHTAVVRDVSNHTLGAEKRFQGTLYEYLYSEYFEEFQASGSAQKDHSGNLQTIWFSGSSKNYFVKLKTSQKPEAAKLNVWVSFSSNPASEYTIHASATDAGAFCFDGISVSSDDRSAVLDKVTIHQIKVAKKKHTVLKTKYQTRIYTPGDPDWKEEEEGDGGLGGFVKPQKESCAGTQQSFSFVFTHNDGEHTESNGNYPLTYRLNYGSVYSEKSGPWGDWEILSKNTCLKDGKKQHSRNYTCSNCGKITRTEKKQETIKAHGHNWEPDNWMYETCPVSGIARGVRYRQCTYHCQEEGWRKDYQYLNEVYYRFMNSDGTYPSNYTASSSGYYGSGDTVPGYSYTDNGTSDFRTAGLAPYAGTASARKNFVDIPRKRYLIVYHKNGAMSGTMENQSIYCGQKFSVSQNRFGRTGYDFAGFNERADGKGKKYVPGESVNTSLTTTDGAVVTLYAQWTPAVMKITLDSQGAWKQGEDAVYQKYTAGYYQDGKALQKFSDHKIEIPEKTVPDASLPDGVRRQTFLGYFTRKQGQGHRMVQKDGTLVSNINNAGNYKYFVQNSTVYAAWQDMYAVRYSDNFTEKDYLVAGKEKNILPQVKWKEKGKDLTVEFETAEVANEDFKKIYRLKGWSLKPEISGEEELILSPQKTSCTFVEDQDVTLYAQWDTSFQVAYLGNRQSEGNDYLDLAEKVTESYLFHPNVKEQLEQENADYFEKSVEKETLDIETGEAADEEGNPYTEMIPCSFQGWSMFRDDVKQRENIDFCYKNQDGGQPGGELILKAVRAKKADESQGLTFDLPVKDFGTFNAPHKSDDQATETKGGAPEEKKGVPYINMYAVWDEFPQIKASDLYFPLSFAQNGTLTQEYLLGFAEATDKELENVTDAKGTIPAGEDSARGTVFCISDYQESDFTGAESSMSITITYCAKDQAGNITSKMVTVHLADTGAREYDNGKVRFISEEYMDTLPEKSVWRTEEYGAVLNKVLKNNKNGEEYTNPSGVERLLGAKPVKKPGSGTWNHVMQVWKFTRQQVLEVQDFLENHGILGSQQAFLDRFGACRVQ